MVESPQGHTPKPIRLVIAEDQPLMRRALEEFYSGEPGYDVVGTASDGAEAVHRVAELEPDVILMDIEMPTMTGIEATREICASQAPTKVVMLTTFSVMDKVSAALRAGASGYLVKDATPEDLLEAVVRVMRDETVVSPAVTQLLVDEVMSEEPERGSGVTADEKAPKLTTRELEVLECLAGGLSNKEIAAELYLSEGSVKLHLGKACDRLEARDRVQLLVRAVELGLVSPKLSKPETAWERFS